MFKPVDGFDWDAGNAAKCCKHGATLEDVEAVFRGGIDVYPDVAHSNSETRFFGIGQTLAKRYLFVAFTLRKKDGEQLIRPISARFMHAKEVNHYVAEIARRKD
jgi:uncharacterized protein